MFVTGIEAVTKKKCKVELDGQLAFVLYKGELARYCVKIGEELSWEKYTEIVDEVLLKRAKKYLLHLLTKMDRTTYELENKLRRGFYPEDVIEKAITYVKGYGYVDDTDYALAYLRTYEERLSHRQIKRKLATKGISKDILDSLDDERRQDEGELIKIYIRKKIRDKEVLDDKELKRVADYLYRKGFESGDIWNNLKGYRQEGEDNLE
jgi:Uncharacterized protein conserved in bacteria